MVLPDISEKINKQIDEITDNVIKGKISLLNQELVPIFNTIRNSITISNLVNYSKTYANACELLNLKFQELKNLLQSLNSERKFYEYLDSNPDDSEIKELFKGCWIKNFSLNALSIEYLEDCKKRLCKEKTISIPPPPPPEKEITNEEFILEVPLHDFNQQIESFFLKIKDKFPCPFNNIFEDEQDQSEIFKNFVFLLHLFQLGKVQYQKETDYLYLEEVEEK